MRDTHLRLLTATIIAALTVAIAARGGQSDNQSGDQNSGMPYHGIDLSSLDKTCKPCQDFYRYANGEWLKKNPIPAAYPSWGRFSELAERNREHLRQILEAAAANRSATPGSNEQKIGDFYASCMDEKTVNAEGVKPLQHEFGHIQAINSQSDLQAEVAHLQLEGIDAMFNFGSTQDAKNSSEVIGGAEQGGLGLPDRDYYLDTGNKAVDEKNREVRQKYVQHVARMFELMGDPEATAAAEAKTVMDIETKLAEVSMNRVDRRDPDKTYHKMNRDQVQALMPNFSWNSYFTDIDHPAISIVDVAEPDFFKGLNTQLQAVPIPDWKTYLRWHLIHGTAPTLSQPFVEENFNFEGKVLQGTEEILPRWKRCVRAADQQLGEALGQSYVKQYFPPEAKARALEMVNNLTAALREDLQTLPWMGPATRAQALSKLAAFTRKIGYPDKWRDYSRYKVDRGPYVLNFLRGNNFESERDLNKIGKPVDRAEWDMTPPTVNAYYNPELNEIVFPAGILQPPFFDPKADDASNYGGIGAVIGHEMTHGFDDQGRKFDAQGNLRDWWTAEDAKNFSARAECVEKQFDSYVVEGDLHENGKLVLGESIADLGGLTIAHRALEKALEGKPSTPTDGFTPAQRFFIAYAQIWAANDRPEFMRLLVNTNPHPVDRFRAIAAPSNMPDFAKAFDCTSGDPMERPPDMRCQIW